MQGTYALEEIILEFRYIVNCVDPLINESHKSNFDAIKINSLLPHYLTKLGPN